MSEQWKRYHAAWQNYYQKYYANYYSAALEQQKKKIANIQPEVIEELTESQKKERNHCSVIIYVLAVQPIDFCIC